MDIKKLLSNKKFKNILITVGEVILVAGIIFGVLMYIQSKVTKEAEQAQGLNGNGTQSTSTKKKAESSDIYELQVNIKKKAMTVYQYSKDKKSKKAVRVVACAVGSDLKTGKYKTSTTYSWLNINGGWHQYNTQIGKKAWIQSAAYRESQPYSLSKKSYREIGQQKTAGSCIMLYAKDAQWIVSKCKEGTVIHIDKGKKSDKLPLQIEGTVAPLKDCGWDPTDPNSSNPYKKAKNAKIVKGLDVVHVEKGHEPEYLGNLLAKNKSGKNITGKLSYQPIDTNVLGTYKVKFVYKMKKGKDLTCTQKFVVEDTTPPVVTCSEKLFEYEVESEEVPDVNNEENIKNIIKMVREKVSCNESGVNIEVTMVSKEELEVDKKVPVVITAQDSSGNIGSCQVMCEIKVKEPETTELETETTKPPETTTKKVEPVTKKKTKKKPKKKKEIATTKPAVENETTVQAEETAITANE